MKSFATVAALVSVLPTVFGLTINTPTGAVLCEPLLFSWTDGTAPFFLSLLPGGQPSATPLEQFPSTSDTSFTWTVNQPAGTSITAQIKDSTGTIGFTQAFNVQSGSDSSCLNASASGSSGATGAASGSSGAASTGAASSSGAAAPGAASSTGAAAGTSGGSAATTSAKSGSPATTGAGASSSKAAGSSNGSAAAAAATTSAKSSASRSTVATSFGVAAVMGLVGATLF